jgi:hypothetical protein
MRQIQTERERDSNEEKQRQKGIETEKGKER